ncbi:transposase [Campylobacter troglodytis]|uniref:transposase n=1 Tax=Campylobacter troglodytis TaxID=654363 RepID=UPI00115AE0C0|nr:transposase [Campylobacter troglodytis]
MVEVDESYFLLRFVLQLLAEGAKRVRGKRGRGAGKKMFVFLLRTRNCKQKVC